jgi:CRP-like cAMP-binding protein
VNDRAAGPLTVVEKIIVLKNVDLFEGMSVQDLGRLAEICREERYGVGDVLYRESEIARQAFVIVDGTVSVQFRGVELVKMVRGEAFGGPAILDGSAHESSAVALARCHALVLGRDEVLEVMDRYPTVKTNLMRFMIRNVRALRRKMVALELRIRELEARTSDCFSPLARARERGCDRLLRFAAIHNSVPAGEMVFSERSEEYDGRPCLRRSCDSALDLHSEFFGYTHRLRTSAWFADGTLVAGESTMQENLQNLRSELRRADGALRLRVVNDDRTAESRLDDDAFDLTELEALLVAPSDLEALAAAESRRADVLFVSEGILRRGRLRHLGAETVASGARSLPAHHVRYEMAEISFDVWFHAASRLPLRIVWADANLLTAELDFAEGFAELELPAAP